MQPSAGALSRRWSRWKRSFPGKSLLHVVKCLFWYVWQACGILPIDPCVLLKVWKIRYGFRSTVPFRVPIWNRIVFACLQYRLFCLSWQCRCQHASCRILFSALTKRHYTFYFINWTTLDHKEFHQQHPHQLRLVTLQFLLFRTGCWLWQKMPRPPRPSLWLIPRLGLPTRCSASKELPLSTSVLLSTVVPEFPLWW